MAAGFTKLFSSITESTVWGESHATRIVWITMLAMADRKGRVWASVPGLANRARVALEECEYALGRFMEPDGYSRTTDHDGRRIEKIEGGWRLLNYAKYREMRDHAARLEYQREWDRRHRERHPTKSDKSDKIRPRPTKAEAELRKETTAGKPANAESYPPEFEETWALYPGRDGDNPKRRAYKAYRARLTEGHTPDEIRAGVERYAAWVRARGREGTETVKQAATFFGPDKPFLLTWPSERPAQPLRVAV